MPSAVTGIIGGIQGASAAHDAAAAQQRGYSQAAGSVNSAVASANPILSAAADYAGSGVTKAAGDAASGVNTAAGTANSFLSPFINAGTTALGNLNALGQQQFSFNPSNLENDPGYQFQLTQGMKALNNSAAARGLSASGSTLKAAANYEQGVAGTSYNNAYNRALGTYQTNFQNTYSTLMPQVQLGYGASGQAGANLLGAAQYGGNMGMQGAQYAGNANMWAGGQQASNLINAGVYQGNTQIGSGNAQAQGDIGAANAWNGMLGSIGQAGNTALMAGMGPGGWSFGNMGTNFSNLFAAGGYGGGGGLSGPMYSNGVVMNNGYMPPNVNPRG